MSFYFSCFNEYLNFYRPCAFPIEVNDKKGKIKTMKKYRYPDYMTPYEKFRSVSDARIYLKESITFEMLDKIARRHTNNEMVKNKLFDKIVAA